MTLKEFLTAFFGKTLNLPAEKVASLFNDEGTEAKPEALETLLTAHAAKVQAFKTENQTYFDNGMKKATKEVMTDFEKAIKEQYGVTSEKLGAELIAEIVASKTKAGELDENKVKLHPLYLELEAKRAKEVKDTEKIWKDKLDTREKQIVKEKTFTNVTQKADVFLKEFALPEDEKLAHNQKTLLLNELNKFEFQENGDEVIVLDSAGKPVEDDHGNKKPFAEIVKGIAGNYWPKLDGQQRSGTGANNDPKNKGKQGSAWNGKTPANEAEFSAALAGAKTGEERIAITDAFDKAQGVGK